MRTKKIVQTPTQDQNYLNNIYLKIVEKMEVLDKLNIEYKAKQEGHFLKTFMNVLEKMGNDLIQAQQAYKHIDLEARKDDYCLLLASELNFFKEQSFSLREVLNTREKEVYDLKIENGTLESELASMKQGFDMKIKQCMKLKSEIKELKKQIKYLSEPNNSIFKFTNPQIAKNINLSSNSKKKSMSLTNYLEEGSLQLYKVANRFTKTNGHDRRKNNSLTLEVKGHQTTRNHLSRTPNDTIQLDLGLTRKNEISTHSSFRKKMMNLPFNRRVLESYQPFTDQ